MGIGDWGLGIGDWGLGPIPNPPSPLPHPPSPIPIMTYNLLLFIYFTHFIFSILEGKLINIFSNLFLYSSSSFFK